MVVDHEDARDVLQDTLSSVYLHLWQVRDESKLRPWLYTVATNKANKFLSKKSRRLDCEDMGEYLANTLTASEQVDYQKAAAIDLHKAVLALPPQQKLVFNLRFFDELEYEEISRITGFSQESLRVSYHIAKKKVQQYIKDEQI